VYLSSMLSTSKTMMQNPLLAFFLPILMNSELELAQMIEDLYVNSKVMLGVNHSLSSSV